MEQCTLLAQCLVLFSGLLFFADNFPSPRSRTITVIVMMCVILFTLLLCAWLATVSLRRAIAKKIKKFCCCCLKKRKSKRGAEGGSSHKQHKAVVAMQTELEALHAEGRVLVERWLMVK